MEDVRSIFRTIGHVTPRMSKGKSVNFVLLKRFGQAKSMEFDFCNSCLFQASVPKLGSKTVETVYQKTSVELLLGVKKSGDVSLNSPTTMRFTFSVFFRPLFRMLNFVDARFYLIVRM